MNDNAQQTLLAHLSLLIGPLRAVAESKYLLRNFARSIGWDLDEITGLPLGELQSRLSEFASSFETLSGFVESPPQTLSELGGALDAADHAFGAIRDISTILAEDAQPPQFKEFGRDLISAMTIAHLQVAAPVLYHLAVLLTIIEPANDNALSDPVFDSTGKLVRVPHMRPELRFKRIVDLIKSPGELLKTEYIGPGGLETSADARRVADKLFPRLGALLTAFGANVVYGFKPGYGLDLADPENLASGALTFWLDLPIEGGGVGATLSLSPAERGNLGLVVSPFGVAEFTRLFGEWALNASLTAGVDAFALGPDGLRLILGEGGSADRISARLALSRQAEAEDSFTRIGSASGTRLEARRLRVLGEANLGMAEQEYGLLAEVGEAVLVVAPGDGDGFLQKILPADGLRMNFDLALGWSNRKGFYFRGGAGLEARLPLQISLGSISVQSVHLAARAEGEEISNELAATVSLRLGPVIAVVERVGLTATLAFPEDGGNLGGANLEIGFKYPNGVGLSIDKAGVSGGGYLYFDKEKGQYAGVAQLNLHGDISVKGIGLIATRLPDNSKGFSLLVIITAEDFKPIPLPLGFKLTGIGGLLALNRTFDEEVLRAGLKNNALDSVMFPKDPIRNAPQIISNLNKVFPVAEGHHLFGPVAQITWGAKGLLTANLALVLELGERLRLLILAQIAVILPRPENDLIRLKMDAAGVIDFDQGRASLDATLHDSRLLKKYTLTGDMAMRLKWRDGPNFALAVGGLHPAFNPPPNFPKLERVAINLSSGDKLRIRCESYFALTSNTVQFGSRTELYAEALGFSVQGEIGYDALIQLDPFQFLADFHAQVQLKRGSRNLFKVRLEGELSGPRPLRIKAKATFEVLWMDVSFRVDKTLVSGVRPEAPAPVVVMPLLKEALSNPGNWVAKLPAGGRQMATLRAAPVAADDVLLHPLGTLTVKQNVVPLNMDISRFGPTTPDGARRFTITNVSIGGQNQTALRAVKDFFAPAQFFEMSDGEKLSRPSFEMMTAGVAIGSDEIAITTEAADWLEVDAIKFETVVVNKQRNESRRSASGLYELSREHLGKQARFGAAGASELRRSGNAKYRAAAPKYRIVKEGWSIVATDDLAERPAPVVESYSEAAQALRELKQENPAVAAGLKILRPSELPE